MNKIHRILYFCAGNTCRSPFAEAYSKWLKQTKYQVELKDVEFDSAGIYHYYKTAQPGTMNYLRSKGIDITGFKTKKIDDQLLERQDLILGFEQKHHINKLHRKFKNVKKINNITHLLLEYAGETENLEIKDPFDLDEKEYNDIMRRIEKGVDKVVKKIIKLNNKYKAS
ncbi:MAG: arsenate reductase/protein-tyrosine-phosphatase family protein [Promethearchaeota archaeon]|jgi:protein-tyrosine-phosphatase